VAGIEHQLYFLLQLFAFDLLDFLVPHVGGHQFAGPQSDGAVVVDDGFWKLPGFKFDLDCLVLLGDCC
jgi:hypothetical protein